ncbi:MAG: FKBP-type peptidyl-prolyl cis-trans isomerase N-terminal domain-containing protein [Rhabdochlamydiaceae bacterium]
MKKVVAFLFSMSFLTAEEAAPAQESAPIQPNIEKISEAFGHLLGKNLESMGMKFDIVKVIQGLKDAQEGKAAPMSEAECIQAITAVQETVFKETSAENLKEAENFLATNKTIAGVQVLEEGKLQYKVTHEGKGAVIDENSSPLIRYTGKFLNGSVFGASKEEEMVRLDETIPGFSKGLLGMKEGEKRTLFIHPDLGYGTHGYLPPNSLITFEIEVVQANAPHTEALDSLSPITPKTKGNPEIASPFEEPKVIR